MRVSKIETTIVTVPFSRPEIWARGARPCVTNVIVEMTTDEGIVGLGETGGGEGAAASIQDMKPYLLNFDPFDIEILNQRWCHYRQSPPLGYAAIEMAMLDIQGKATGKPVYNLLGGAVHRRVPYMYYLLRDNPKVMAEEAKKAVEAGGRPFTSRLE